MTALHVSPSRPCICQRRKATSSSILVVEVDAALAALSSGWVKSAVLLAEVPELHWGQTAL